MKKVRIYEVCYNTGNDGPMGDGVSIFRTKRLMEAEEFAKGKRFYSGKATVETCEVPPNIAKRWGF